MKLEADYSESEQRAIDSITKMIDAIKKHYEDKAKFCRSNEEIMNLKKLYLQEIEPYIKVLTTIYSTAKRTIILK